MDRRKSNYKKPKTNRLINEKSPYLQQHAYNPVDWHPWDDVAIGQSVTENKPILLSIGYSSCHWCHVMERESFEDEQTAAIMNQYFINIKVDREERPDLDAIYMAAVSTLTGRGGWPLNVFLTPQLKPFFGGTYFPAEDHFNMMSWKSILLRITKAWNDPDGRKKIEEIAEDIIAKLHAYLSRSESTIHDLTKPLWGLPDRAFHHYKSLFDEKNGGFGLSPKFPSPVIQNFLFAYGDTKENADQEKALKMACDTLKAMARGGIYDQLGGGFHRYSTDVHWRVPHFEKMLYDNAQLIINYTDAFVLTREGLFRKIAMETADYLLRDMKDQSGGFFSAEDADSLPNFESANRGRSDKKEGAFYVWGKNEFEEILGKGNLICDLAVFYFGVMVQGNVENDPNHEFAGKNILYEAHPIEKVKEKFSITAEEALVLINEAKKKLFEDRKKRNRPGLDGKIITSWNGLAVSALSKAFKAFDEKRYLDAAKDAVEFIWDHLYAVEDRKLFRRWKSGEKKVQGLCEDYAFLIQGLIDLYDADPKPEWLDRAFELNEKQILTFYDKDHAGFFMTGEAHDPHLILRVKEENDQAVPGANSISVMNLIRLSRMFGRDDFRVMAEKTVSSFYEKMNQFPGSMPQLLVALKNLEIDK
jgi:uncharacterized protein